MNDWASAFWTLVGYAIAAGLLFLPIVVLLLVMRTRAWRRRKRIRWAGRDMPLLWERGAMDRLPPPFNEDPEVSRGRRR